MTEQTPAAKNDDAQAAHEPDRMPTPDEERAAEQNQLDPSVAEHYKDAARTGANIKGEGEVE
jgi:hypothetical protein